MIGVPDFIANARSVISAAYSMESRDSPFRADPDEVLKTTLEKIRSNVGIVAGMAESEGIQSHAAARKLAQDRVGEAKLLQNGGQATTRS